MTGFKFFICSANRAFRVEQGYVKINAAHSSQLIRYSLHCFGLCSSQFPHRSVLSGQFAAVNNANYACHSSPKMNFSSDWTNIGSFPQKTF